MSDPMVAIAREHSDRSNLMFLPARTDAHPHEASLRAQRSNLIRRVIPTQSEANGKRRSEKRSSIAAGQARIRNFETKVIQPWGLLLVAGLALMIAVVTFDPQLDQEVDSADYIVLGKSLRAGLGMRYIHLPEAPKPHKFPVGFPLLLAGVEWAAPDSLVARKVLVAACYVGAVALFFRLASTYVTPLTALLVTVLTALNPFVLGMTRIVMSEIPYLFCSLVVLSILERALDSPDPPPRWAWVGGMLTLLFAAQVRTIGWSLLLALVVVLLLRRRYGTLGLTLAGVGILIGLLYLAEVGPIGSRYFEVWEERMTDSPEATGDGAAAAVLRRVGVSLLRYILLVIPVTFLPIPLERVSLTPFRFLPGVLPEGADGAWVYLLQVLLAAFCLLLLVRGAWPSLRDGRLTSYYTATFMGILFFWPPEFVWGRMVVPVIPFLFLFGTIGLQRLWTWARPRVPALNQGALVGVLTLAQLWGSVRLGVLDQDHFPQWVEFVNTAEWIRAHTDPHDLILTDFPAHLYILTGRNADFLFRRRTEVSVKVFEDFGQLVRHIDQAGAKHLVDDGISLTTEGLKQKLFALAAQPGSRWKIAYRGRGNGVYVRSDLLATPEALEGAPRALGLTAGQEKASGPRRSE